PTHASRDAEADARRIRRSSSVLHLPARIANQTRCDNLAQTLAPLTRDEQAALRHSPKKVFWIRRAGSLERFVKSAAARLNHRDTKAPRTAPLLVSWWLIARSNCSRARLLSLPGVALFASRLCGRSTCASRCAAR